jgi:hypothetical protein
MTGCMSDFTLKAASRVALIPFLCYSTDLINSRGAQPEMASTPASPPTARTMLLTGASRGIGHAVKGAELLIDGGQLVRGGV